MKKLFIMFVLLSAFVSCSAIEKSQNLEKDGETNTELPESEVPEGESPEVEGPEGEVPGIVVTKFSFSKYESTYYVSGARVQIIIDGKFSIYNYGSYTTFNSNFFKVDEYTLATVATKDFPAFKVVMKEPIPNNAILESSKIKEVYVDGNLRISL